MYQSVLLNSITLIHIIVNGLILSKYLEETRFPSIKDTMILFIFNSMIFHIIGIVAEW